MQLNDDLRIYRNVYQKLLLRTRRNPQNSQYEKDFQQFKQKNIELKEKIDNGEITQKEYMEWLNKQQMGFDMMKEITYRIYADESVSDGKYYSNFYGRCIN